MSFLLSHCKSGVLLVSLVPIEPPEETLWFQFFIKLLEETRSSSLQAVRLPSLFWQTRARLWWGNNECFSHKENLWAPGGGQAGWGSLSAAKWPLGFCAPAEPQRSVNTGQVVAGSIRTPERRLASDCHVDRRWPGLSRGPRSLLCSWRGFPAQRRMLA